MPNFFPFRMPYWHPSYYENHYRRYAYSNNQKNSYEQVENENSTTRTNSSSTNNSFDDNNQPYISILGLDLFSDDILILCVLLFLYTEGIKDEMLFICLILLLLS